MVSNFRLLITIGCPETSVQFTTIFCVISQKGGDHNEDEILSPNLKFEPKFFSQFLLIAFSTVTVLRTIKNAKSITIFGLSLEIRQCYIFHIQYCDNRVICR